MKKVSLKLALGGLIFVFLMGNAGCKKLKKGVIVYFEYEYGVNTAWGTPFSTNNTSRYAEVVGGDNMGLPDGSPVIDENIEVTDGSNYVGGQVVQSGLNIIMTYKSKTYYSDENLKNLGFGKDGRIETGKKNGKASILGVWNHEESGLVIAVTGFTSGDAKILETGTAFPESARGGIPWSDINHEEGNTYSFLNNTYFPNSGWVSGSYLQIEMSENGNSFTLGGQTYRRGFN